MHQLRCRPRLVEKALSKSRTSQEIRCWSLQRDLSLELEIASAKNDTHPAAADLLENFEGTDLSRQCLRLKELFVLHAGYLHAASFSGRISAGLQFFLFGIPCIMMVSEVHKVKLGCRAFCSDHDRTGVPSGPTMRQ